MKNESANARGLLTSVTLPRKEYNMLISSFIKLNLLKDLYHAGLIFGNTEIMSALFEEEEE